MFVDINKIKITRKGTRTSAISGLIESIEKLGVNSPLLVNKQYELIDGGQRLAACKELGIKKVPIQIVDLEELDMRLLHLDMNQARSDWTGAMLDWTIGERKEIYEEKYPETKHGASRGNGKGGSIKTRNPRLNHTPSFVEDTAKQYGMSERSVQESVARYNQSSPRVGDAYRKDKLGSSQVNELIKLEKKDQDKLLPILYDKSVSETSQIVEIAKEHGVAYAIEQTEVMDGAIKLYKDMKTHGTRLSYLLSSGVQSEIRFIGNEKIDVFRLLAEVRAATNEYMRMYKEK